MTDKVQKIKDWISKEQDGLLDTQGNFEYPEHEGAYHILCNLDAYIDSLQEEPKPKFKIGDKVVSESCKYAEIESIDTDKYWCKGENGMSIPFKYQDKWELVEEPVSDDLEEASKEWLRPQLDKSYANYGEAKMMELTHFDGYAMLDAIEFGAKWQKAKDESITNDLGEYINELSKQFPEVSFAKLSRIAVRVAKWQKEQMAAKTIDGDITFDYYGDDDKTYGCVAHDSFCLEDFGLKDRDKVKVIVIKED